ncbi:MAG TPA: hypothetical protein VD860_05470 [Azospirillum sp.]|nr:hypothetical protein [Azospirillum sp.]
MSRPHGVSAGDRYMKVDTKRRYVVVAVIAKPGHAAHARLQAEGGVPDERLIGVSALGDPAAWRRTEQAPVSKGVS